MASIKLSDAFVALLQRKGLAQKNLILLTDDGGGKYSLQGGACTIGTNFSLIVIDKPDQEYPIKLNNDQGIRLWTSDYDMMFLESGVSMDYGNGQISIKDDAYAALDNGVRIANGQDVLDAFEQGITMKGESC
ncbi:hypothetical protein FC99_GL002231 [Levilactobacillus koreensis JCM 16448]|uniref:Fe-S cluster biosynthesis protein n=1 Tax=Levilactobacillus koreensis TaxID=637971 RepID=A0AAC8UXE0_9LACO|nr:iron-sulfur cluster biosynthesis family protein [Levilactobacillus koreensis]AKP65657.1 Fe-S cluster biosynthesis protein [Levilactobacillus koreensis]KRK85749.1 hypothetical protein FC99_GL002231 [Levilactobacillus koreensis JCM 16448]